VYCVDQSCAVEMWSVFCDVESDEEVTIELELKEVLQLLIALNSCIAISWARGNYI